MMQPHCSVDYHEFNGADLETKGHAVSAGIYGHPATFTAPPITQLVFDGLVETLHNAYEAYKNAPGPVQKGAYLTARTNLITVMDTTGQYVDGLPGVDEAMILLAGFTPTKTGETSAVVPAAPVIDRIERNSTKTLEPICKAVHGAEYYGCFVLEQPWNDSLFFFNGLIAVNSGPTSSGPVRLVVTKGRRKIIPDLETGKTYWIYFFAGNSAGVSQLSEGKSINCD